ncbi:unnamed protein product, partial [marine sediment metagenome]
MPVDMDRKGRIDSLLDFIKENGGQYRHVVLDKFSYGSGISRRTCQEYLSILVSLGRVKLTDSNWQGH